MKQTKTTKIALVSILAASSVVLGYFIKIPTPTGIFTLLDVVSSLQPFTLAAVKEPLSEV